MVLRYQFRAESVRLSLTIPGMDFRITFELPLIFNSFRQLSVLYIYSLIYSNFCNKLAQISRNANSRLNEVHVVMFYVITTFVERTFA